MIVVIVIVVEMCFFFIVFLVLMNEYWVLELNVQNGVLKLFFFLFEYIGEMGKDYIYVVILLLEDVLMDWDFVYRQIVVLVVKYMVLGVVGFGCEDVLIYLLNFLWFNIFEILFYVINVVMEVIEGMWVVLGFIILLNYCLQGLFYFVRKV